MPVSTSGTARYGPSLFSVSIWGERCFLGILTGCCTVFLTAFSGFSLHWVVGQVFWPVAVGRRAVDSARRAWLGKALGEINHQGGSFTRQLSRPAKSAATMHDEAGARAERPRLGCSWGQLVSSGSLAEAGLPDRGQAIGNPLQDQVFVGPNHFSCFRLISLRRGQLLQAHHGAVEPDPSVPVNHHCFWMQLVRLTGGRGLGQLSLVAAGGRLKVEVVSTMSGTSAVAARATAGCRE